VGRNLVLSLEASGRAVFPFPSPLFGREHERFPFINRSIQDRYLDRDAPHGYPKGGTLVLDRAHLNPIQRGRRAAHDEGTTLGAPLTARLSRALGRERSIGYETFVEMLPRASAHVRLDPGVNDANGLPVARITVDDFPGEAERVARVASLGRELLVRMNPAALVDDARLRRTYFLQAGTCRMGRDPASSVCDPRGRVHGIEGLVVCDGSALPSMGGVPPTLTIMANALRIAELLVNETLAR
jgi:choline dehydrogenase-like flavoprotein